MNLPTDLDLSIIIPCFNEERRLPSALDKIQQYLRDQGREAATEVIVVDDGSSDATSRGVVARQQSFPQLRLLSNGRNRGKGYSVRHGMLESRGRVALFTDADLSSPIGESARLFSALDGAEIAIGSRALDRSLIQIHQSKLREFAGILFNRIVRVATWLPFEDTQCGFKAFRMPDCRAVFEQQCIEGFGFDPEILFIACLQRLRVVEVPVRWAHDPATKVNVLRDSLRMFADLFVLRWNWLLGRYSRVRAAGVPGSSPSRK
jgi:dolichyl-phosphate beta-glucosyltransferase